MAPSKSSNLFTFCIEFALAGRVGVGRCVLLVGLAGLGPWSVLLAGWEVRPVRAFLGAVALILGGCAAAQPSHWEKPGATQEAFRRDRYVCLQQTPQDRAGNYNTTLFASCMGARGYKEDPNGDLSPPPQAVVGH